jgi:hypothetical protein
VLDDKPALCVNPEDQNGSFTFPGNGYQKELVIEGMLRF